MERLTTHKKIYTRKQESKDEPYFFMKVATNVIFNPMYVKDGSKNIGEKAVSAMKK